jgi:hypothetical protein
MPKLMGTKEDIAAVGVQRRAVEAAHLQANRPGITRGSHVGRWVLGGDWLYQGQRKYGLFLMGPGRGKSRALLVRGARWASGAYTMAGNKLDGVQPRRPGLDAGHATGLPEVRETRF